MQTMQYLSKNLKHLRSLHGISQRELADRIGVSHPRISEIESAHANPTLATLQAIADAFGITVSTLLRDQEKNCRKIAN